MKNNIPQGYKATSLGIIPQEWEIKKLEEVGKLFSGLTYSPSDIQADGILVLRSSNIQKGQLVFEDNVFVNTPSYTPVKENDILICVRNGSRNLIGKTAMITKEVEGCAFGAFMSIFRSPINKYIFYLFGTELYRKYIYRNLGATINSINGNDLKRFRFPFPQIVEQQKIVNILSTWDKSIEKQSQLIEKLELRKKGLMQQLLSEKKRLPRFSGKWYKVAFSSIIEKISNGYVYKTTDIGYVPITRIETISKGIIDYTKVGYIRYAKDLEKYKLRKGDILFSHINSIAHIGKVAIYKGDKDLYHGMNLLLIRANETMNKNFLYYFLSSTIARKKVRSFAKQAVNQASVNTDELKNWVLYIPPKEEQTAIAQVLTSADHEIELAKQKLKLLRQQKHGLMQQLLTGKKRVKY